MKKTIFILGMVIVLILGNVVAAFADAIAYDMEKAGYYVYVATPDGGLNMRYGPGTEYDRVMDGRIPDDVRLYIGYTSGNWGYTSYNGYEGWVALRQTTTTPPVAKEIPVQEKVEEPIAEATEQAIAEPVQEEMAQDQVQENLEEAEDSEVVKGAMLNQIILIAAILILVIVVAVLVLIIINLKAKK